MTFEAIDKEAAALLSSGNPLANRVNWLVGAADEDGADDASKLESLSNLLCYEKCAEAAAWFVARGVRF